MRNLKKILALVLALVMSLSLMAVASADDELNLGDVSDVYAESVDVLTGLKVFMGNKGEFLPKDNITRAEVAAIIYRIVTGDVADAQKGIYADYNKFSDVTSDAWYAGYVNYCANAEYVKGVGYDANGKAMFKPQQNVTGYEALAMILRAIGYDRNNEFTGPSWQIQTAATARNRGILKNIAEGTLGTAATREAVAEILCQTILVPVADYSLAFGYRTTDANGKDNETLAYKTFKMEKIDGVVMANEQASLTAATPLPAGQTTLGERTLNVASTLDDIGESRYVYVVPAAGTTRYDLVTTKTYDTGLNQVYDNEGAKVATVGDSTGKDNGITSIAGAQHFINFEEIQEWTATWRLEYVLQVKMSEYDAKTMYYENGTANNSHLIDLFYENNNTDTSKIQAERNGVKPVPVVPRPSQAQYENRANGSGAWKQIAENNTSNPNGFTYEYRKVINSGEKLTPTDIANIKAIFTSANYAGGKFIEGEVYAGTNTSNNNVTINGTNVVISSTADLSDRMNYEQFVENYLKGTDNKRQVTSSGLGQHLKIVDNNNDGVAEYILQTIYTVAIINANGGLDIANAEFSHNNPADEINQVVTTTPVVNDGEGELATGNVVIYALIDGNARAQLAATETVKINTVNRADSTATATGEDGKTWTESSVHTHSPNMKSGVTGMVGNTTYTLYFDLYGNLAAYTEGENGAFVLITDGWYRNAINGGEYAVKAYIDGTIQTVELTAGGSLFVNNSVSNNQWNMLKPVAGLNAPSDTVKNDVTTFIANLDGSVITPVDKMYNYLKTVRVLDVEGDKVPGSALESARVRDTNYSRGTAYVDGSADAYNARVSALSNTVYYYVFNSSNNNTVVRTFTGYGSTPTINANYIEDVYVVGTLANNSYGNHYYTADAVVVELNNDYADSARRTGEPVFVPDFRELTDNLGFENVRMIRSSTGEEVTLRVNMGKSNLDWYDKTNGAENEYGDSDRIPGLFYLNEDDAKPGDYILDRMSPAQVRGESCILTGYINRSTATQINNYATVDLMSIDDQGTEDKSDDEIVPTKRTTGTTIDNRAKLVESSKYYTLAYNASRIADLKVSDAATVLAQNTTRNPLDNTTTLLNEQVDTLYNNAQMNLNEVLIFTNGNITAAISFNEYRNFANVTRDHAQEVWSWCLPSLNEDQDVKFYGVGDADNDKTITVTYAQAKAWDDAGKETIGIDLGALEANTNVQSWTLTRVTSGLDQNNNWTNITGAKITPETTRQEYRLTINYYVGGSDTYTLIQEPANTTAELRQRSDNTEVTNLGAVPAKGTLDSFVKQYYAHPDGAKAVWTWTIDNGVTFTTEGDTADLSNVDCSDGSSARNVTMADIKAVSVTIYAENGQPTKTYADSTTASTPVDAALKKAKDNAVAELDTLATALSAKVPVDAIGGSWLGTSGADTWLLTKTSTTGNGWTVGQSLGDFKARINGEDTVADVNTLLATSRAGLVEATVNAAILSMDRLVGGGLAVSGDADGNFTATNNNNSVTTKYWNEAIKAAIEEAWPAFAGALGDKNDAAKQAAAIDSVIAAYNTAFEKVYEQISPIINGQVVAQPDERYSSAYTTAGVSVTATENGANVTVDHNKFVDWVTSVQTADSSNPNYGPMKSTVTDENVMTTDGVKVSDCLFAGVQFVAPKGTDAVRMTISANGTSKTVTIQKGDGNDLCEVNGVTALHCYIAIATGVTNKNVNLRNTVPTFTYTLQFFGDGGTTPIGAEMTKTVNITTIG